MERTVSPESGAHLVNLRNSRGAAGMERSEQFRDGQHEMEIRPEDRSMESVWEGEDHLRLCI